MADFYMRQGDELPQIERIFSVDGAAVDLTSATKVEFIVTTMDDIEVFKHDAAITNAVEGIVKYAFTTTDSAAMAIGYYKAYFLATFGSLSMTSPNGDFITIQITGLSDNVATYTGNPALRAIDKVRFLSQDTNMASPRLSDPEIEFLLAEHSNDPYDTAASACETAAGTYASYRDKTVGPLSIRYGEQSQRLYDLAKNIRARRARITGFAAVSTQYSEDHIFELGMHDIATNADGNPLNG